MNEREGAEYAASMILRARDCVWKRIQNYRKRLSTVGTTGKRSQQPKV